MRVSAGVRRLRSDRGAILLHVAFAALALIGFSAFVVDYGAMWLGRGQAQNAADAGALAGAVARAFDEPEDPPSAGGKAETSARLAAASNTVWSAAPAATIAVSWDCPPFMAGATGCAHVDVAQDTMPTFFLPLLNVSATNQRVRATATAQAKPADATDCLGPLAISDKWTEVLAPATTYNAWEPDGLVRLPNPADSYLAPGFTLLTDFGSPLLAALNSATVGVIVPAPGGPREFSAAFGHCNGVAVHIGDSLPVDPAATATTIANAVQNLANTVDAGATFDNVLRMVVGTCAPRCAAFSPRVVAVPVFDPDEFQRGTLSGDWSACPTGTPCVHIRNIVGLFVTGITTISGPPADQGVSGYLVRYPGLITSGAAMPSPDAAFLVAANLVR